MNRRITLVLIAIALAVGAAAWHTHQRTVAHEAERAAARERYIQYQSRFLGIPASEVRVPEAMQ
jgi:uncharacterized protein HemX